MLHHIDNIDAHLEMLNMTYTEKAQVAPGIHDHRRPLEGRAVVPLPSGWRRRNRFRAANAATATGGGACLLLNFSQFSQIHFAPSPVVKMCRFPLQA